MNSKKLKELQEEGQASISGKMTALIGAVIIIFLAVALAPEMFEQTASLEAVNGTGDLIHPDIPSYLPTIMFVMIGAGIVFMVWKTFDV